MTAVMDEQPALAFDWNNPDYAPIWAKRIERLAKLREDPALLAAVKLYYRHHIVDFINDWGVTVDPRNVGSRIDVVMPFVLFRRQREFVDWLINRWRNNEDGIVVKSRDCGASWLFMATAESLCLFWDNITIGVGSATAVKVDNAGDPDSLFYKGRMFLRYIPPEFKPNWSEKRCSTDKRLVFPSTESSVVGECGDLIGRSGRKTIYGVDEFAFVEHPKLVDANLVANTNCRIEISSVNGTANVFAERARSGLINRFDFHYRDDPRKVNHGAPYDTVVKDDDGSTRTVHVETGDMHPAFAKKKGKTDPIVWNAEYESNFLASNDGIIIPQEWVQAAIGAAEKLGIKPTGLKRGAYDVADRGNDKNCYASRYGVELRFIQSWSGSSSDMGYSVGRCFSLADDRGDDGFDFDGDGMGAGVRALARIANDERGKSSRRKLRVDQFLGSSAVVDPESLAPGTDRKNGNFFENFKAQSWWGLRWRFYLTYRWIVEGVACNPSDIISISPQLPELTRTCAELSQPVWTWSKSGKMVIDKQPDDVASPNNADAVMMVYATRIPMVFSDELLDQL